MAAKYPVPVVASRVNLDEYVLDEVQYKQFSDSQTEKKIKEIANVLKPMMGEIRVAMQEVDNTKASIMEADALTKDAWRILFGDWIKSNPAPHPVSTPDIDHQLF